MNQWINESTGGWSGVEWSGAEWSGVGRGGCFSSVHIVGSLTSKLPSIIYRRYTQRHQYISVLWSFQQMLSLKTSKTVSIKSRDKCASLHHMCREPYVGTAGIKIEKDTHHLPGSNTTQSMIDAMQLLPGKWSQLVSSSAMDNIPSSAKTSHANHSMLIHMSFGVSEMNRANPWKGSRSGTSYICPV